MIEWKEIYLVGVVAKSNGSGIRLLGVQSQLHSVPAVRAKLRCPILSFSIFKKWENRILFI